MWLLTKLAVAGALAFVILQNSTQQTEKQNSPSPQRAPANNHQAEPTADVNSKVAPTQTVITVHGLCDAGAGKGGDGGKSCDKVMTREQFEALVEALSPGGQPISPMARRNLAKTYADYVAVEAAAKKAGMEDTPQFRALIDWVRLRTITDLYRSTLQEKFRNPSQGEIDAYYQEHLGDFARVALARILVPRENTSTKDKNEFDKKALEAAKAARERAEKGEDPVQVQKETYSALGLDAPPLTDLGKRRRADLVAGQAGEIFSLKVGEVTQIQTEGRNYVIYKVLNKDVLPEEEVKSEISREIYQQKFRDTMKSVIDAAPVELNEQYFGPASPAKVR